MLRLLQALSIIPYCIMVTSKNPYEKEEKSDIIMI